MTYDFRYTGNQFFQDYYWRIYPYVVPFVYPVALMAQTGSAYLTLAVTIERYLVRQFRPKLDPFFFQPSKHYVVPISM